MNLRAQAAGCIARVVGGESLDAALPGALEPVRGPADRGLVQALCYGVLRWHPRLDWIAGRLLKKPFKARDRDLHALLLTGLFQLLEMRVPDHAAVAETVAGARALDKGWATGLLNGVLRRFQREREAWLARADEVPAACWAHPDWLLERYRRDWPDDWSAIATAANVHPPLTLRVNAARVTREAYLERLRAAGIEARACGISPCGVRVDAGIEVSALPGFTEGLVSVQDEAAQLAAPLLAPRAGDRVLDACVAPGGKAAHIRERVPDLGELVALDIDAGRLERARANFERLGLAARWLTGDASDPDAWWDGRPFERILLDAPCSGTGVIRRHPDIKVLRRAADIPALAAAQRRMLEALWPLLTPGGMLLYATCSVLAEENAAVVESFLADRPDAREQPLDPGAGRALRRGHQILPGEHEMDGFYYASLVKA